MLKEICEVEKFFKSTNIWDNIDMMVSSVPNTIATVADAMP